MNPKTTQLVEFRGKKVPARDYGTGGFYLEVATKVELAHADGGFTEVAHDFITLGEKHVVRICIEMKATGQRFYGSAQIKWGGQGADKNDPVENAETSARGRALAAAGYELGHMSSAEDMDRVVESNGHVVAADLPALPEGMNWQGWAVQWGKIKGFTNKNDFLIELEKATNKSRLEPYTITDYQRAVEYFYRLPDPAPVAIEQHNE